MFQPILGESINLLLASSTFVSLICSGLFMRTYATVTLPKLKAVRYRLDHPSNL